MKSLTAVVVALALAGCDDDPVCNCNHVPAVFLCAQPPEPPHWLRIDAGSHYDILTRRYNFLDPSMPPGMYRATVELERRRERVVLLTISTPSFWLLAN